MKFPEPLSKAIEGVSRIRLKGGLVGKTCMVLIVVALATAAIVWAVRDVWSCRIALVLLPALVFVLLWRVISFAGNHPEAALLEGSEFLIHQQMLLATKDVPELPEAPSEPSPDAPLLDDTDPKHLEPDITDSPPQLPFDEKEEKGGAGNG